MQTAHMLRESVPKPPWPRSGPRRKDVRRRRSAPISFLHLPRIRRARMQSKPEMSAELSPRPQSWWNRLPHRQRRSSWARPCQSKRAAAPETRAQAELTVEHEEEPPESTPTNAPAPDSRQAARCRAQRAGQQLAIAYWSRCSTRASGGWKATNCRLKLRPSAALIEMSLGAEAKRLAIATASGVSGPPRRDSKVFSGSVAGMPRPAPHRMAVAETVPNRIPWCGACRRNSARKFARSSITRRNASRGRLG